MEIYLDNSATTRPCEAVIARMETCMREGFYNPSSLYAPALRAEKEMQACRDLVLERLGRAGRVVFTSGGTEADNLAILGGPAAGRGAGRVLYSAGEHPAAAEACRQLAAQGCEVLELPLDRIGRVDLDAAAALLTPQTRLLCVMQVNNETGAVQPLPELAALRAARCREALLHVDGVQGFLRHPLSCEELGIGTYALSAHKVHGPKGIGALWIGPGVRLSPRALGGGQEIGLRSGTENTPGIAGLAEAIRSYPSPNGMRANKQLLWKRIRDGIPEVRVNGPDPESESSAEHILNVSFPPVRGETMLHALEGEGIYVGNGSACSSRRRKDSHVLAAMGTSPALRESAIRFSLSPHNTSGEMEAAAEAVIRIYRLLKPYTRR